MVRLSVVARQLLPGLDPAQRVEFDPPPVPPHEGVRLARMVHMLEGALGACGVEGCPVLELDDHDAAGGARSSPRLVLRDEFPAKFAQLPPRGEGREREEAAALDAASRDFEVESVQAGEL